MKGEIPVIDLTSEDSDSEDIPLNTKSGDSFLSVEQTSVAEPLVLPPTTAGDVKKERVGIKVSVEDLLLSPLDLSNSTKMKNTPSPPLDIRRLSDSELNLSQEISMSPSKRKDSVEERSRQSDFESFSDPDPDEIDRPPVLVPYDIQDAHRDRPCSSSTVRIPHAPSWLMPSLEELLVDVIHSPIPNTSAPPRPLSKKIRRIDPVVQRPVSVVPVLPGYDDDLHDHRPTLPNKSEEDTPSNGLVQTPKAPRGKFSHYSPELTQTLLSVFNERPFATPLDILNLETQTGLTKAQIRRWFMNSRKKRKPEVEKDNVTSQQRYSSYQFSPAGYSPSPSARPSAETLTSSGLKRKSSFTPASGVPAPIKLSENQKRALRMDRAKSATLGELRICLLNNELRVTQLIALYMKKQYDMKKTLLTETARLKETSSKFSPFTEDQRKMMKGWRNDFFLKVAQGLGDEKKDQLECVKNLIVEIWHPLIIYGKLSGISLETAIEDFKIHSARGMASSTTESYIIPGILRYTESHLASKIAR